MFEKAEIILHNFSRTPCVFENYRIDASDKNDIYFLRVSDATSREMPSGWRHGQRDVVFRIIFVTKDTGKRLISTFQLPSRHGSRYDF